MWCHVLRDTTSVWLVLLSILVLSPVSGQKESVGNIRNSNQGMLTTVSLAYFLTTTLNCDEKVSVQKLFAGFVINDFNLEILNPRQVLPSNHGLQRFI